LYPIYASQLVLKRSPHAPLDRIERDMAEYRRLGIRMLGVVPPGLQGEIYEKHPDWRRVSKNTTEIPQVDMQKQPIGGGLCLLGPYGDYLVDILVEIVTKY